MSIAESAAMVIRMIEDFLAEQTVVTVSRQEGVWAGSSLAYVAAPGELQPHSTTQVFSWHRTYDQTIETSSAPINLGPVLSRR